MAFSKLIITGDGGASGYYRKLSDISTENTVDGLKTYLIRDQYDITRELFKSNTNTNTGTKLPQIPYDKVRIKYTWTGHADVSTYTVTRFEFGTNRENMRFLERALFLSHNNTGATDDQGGVQHSIAVPYDKNENQPSGLFGFDDSFDRGQEFPYKKNPVSGAAEIYVNCVDWIVKNITITDNQNGTSRLTVTLVKWSKTYDIAEEYDR